MPNLRIISDNAADRATLAASSTAGSLAVTNLQNDRKGAPWRALSTAARLGITLTTSELIGGAFLPFCNLSPSATMRTRVSNEAARTNQLVYSDHYYVSATGLALSGASLALYAAAAPEGSMNACKLIEGTANTLHEAYKSFTTVTGQLTTVSIFLKAGERTKARFGQVTGGFATGATAIFDLVAGTVSAVTHYGAQAGATASITPAAGGWYRCSVTLASLAGGTWYTATDLVTGTNTVTYAGDGASGLFFIHMQQEAGALTSFYPSTVSFTSRTSVGTYFGSNGLLQTAASGVARMQYNPLNLSAPPFLLLEPAATNLFPYSEGTVAQTSGSAVTNAAVTIPGFAASIQFGDNSVARWSYRSSSAGTTIGSVYTMSLFVVMDDGGVPNPGSNALATKDFTFVVEGSATSSTGTVVSCGNGLYRCSFTFTATATGSGGNGVVKYTPQSARGFRVSGYQLELGAYPSSYTPTAAATGTRAADSATSAAGTRPAGYIDAWQSYDYDSGAVPACPAAAVALRGFTPAQAASAYAYGGGACARHWLPAQMPALGVAIDIADPANAQGYIEAARLVLGEYWSPASNPDYGASMTVQDASKHYRTDGGDLLTDVGTRARKMPLSLSAMPPADRTALLDIVRANGMAAPVLVSLFPGGADQELERDHTIYGKLSSVAAMALPHADRYATQLDIEEV